MSKPLPISRCVLSYKDVYKRQPTSRISPEAPVPVVKVNTIEERPGGAANVAMNIASLGANARLVGLTGIDDAARALSKSLADVNVKCDFVSVPVSYTHLYGCSLATDT